MRQCRKKQKKRRRRKKKKRKKKEKKKQQKKNTYTLGMCAGKPEQWADPQALAAHRNIREWAAQRFTIHPAICHPEMAEVYLLSFAASVTRKHFENDAVLGRGERADGQKEKERDGDRWRCRVSHRASSLFKIVEHDARTAKELARKEPCQSFTGKPGCTDETVLWLPHASVTKSVVHL